MENKEQEIKLSKVSKLVAKQKVGVYDVLSSIHAQARAAQRRNDLDHSDWKSFFRKITRHLESANVKSGVYMFHDKAENISAVCKIDNRVIDVVTIFPKGSGGRLSTKQKSNGQERIVIESADEFYELNEVAICVNEVVALGIQIDNVILV